MASPTDALFNVVEASVALAGFSGIVTALGRRSSGEWRSADRVRLASLLFASLVPFVSALLSLVLLNASLPEGLIWKTSSAVLLLAALAMSSWTLRRGVQQHRSGEARFGGYAIIAYSLLLALLVLQVANVLALGTFWPYFAGLAISLSIGATQFVRLLWFGIVQSRAA